MRWLRVAAQNVLVLGSLAGLAIWGHETDWTFVKFHHSAGGHAHPSMGHVDPQTLDSKVHRHHSEPPLETASAHDLALTGIRLGFPETRPMQEHVIARGSVTYVQTKIAQLSARVPGTVWRVECQVGDAVKEGDVLAILDAAEVGKAKAELLQALVQAELKEQTLERLKAAGESVPERLRQEAHAAMREARVQRYNAQQTLSNLGLPIRLSELTRLSDEQRADRIHFLGLPFSIVEKLDSETTTANLIPVRAPFDGIVIRREITVGEVVSPEHSQLVIADVSQMALKLNISKEDALGVRLGQPVSFTGDGLQGTLETTIAWISTEVDEKTRTVQALATVANPVTDAASLSRGQRMLKANMFGIGKICVRDQPTALTVPTEAVQWTGTEHVVFVARPISSTDSPGHANREWAFERRQVKPGTHADGFTEILTGLNKADQIVINGGHMLKSELIQRLATRQAGREGLRGESGGLKVKSH